MFSNIGKKIKVLAVVLCALGMVLTLLAAIGAWTANVQLSVAGQSMDMDSLLGNRTVYGIVILAVGFVSSWVGSFFIYGFGELIHKTSENNRLLTRLVRQNERTRRSLYGEDE